MPATKLTETERQVLEVLAAEPDAWLNSFYHPIVAAANDSFITAQAICSNLRRRKLVDAEGRGKLARFGINDKGRAALAEAA